MKDINRIFLLFLFVSGCGEDICAGSDFATRQGTCVFKNGHDISSDKIEVGLDIIQEGVTNRFPKKYTKERIHEVYGKISISFVDKNEIATAGECEYSFINYYETFEIRLVYNDICYTNWIFVHEIFHTLLISISDNNGHPDKWYKDGREDENFRWIYSELKDLCNF